MHLHTETFLSCRSRRLYTLNMLHLIIFYIWTGCALEQYFSYPGQGTPTGVFWTVLSVAFILSTSYDGEFQHHGLDTYLRISYDGAADVKPEDPSFYSSDRLCTRQTNTRTN